MANFDNLCITSPLIPAIRQLLAAAMASAMISLIISLYSLFHAKKALAARRHSRLSSPNLLSQSNTSVFSPSLSSTSRLAASWTEVKLTLASLSADSILEMLADTFRFKQLAQDSQMKVSTTSAKASSPSVSLRGTKVMKELHSLILHSSVLFLLGIVVSSVAAVILNTPGPASHDLTKIIIQNRNLMRGLYVVARNKFVADNSDIEIRSEAVDKEWFTTSSPRAVKFKLPDLQKRQVRFADELRMVCAPYEEIERCGISLPIHGTSGAMLLTYSYFKLIDPSRNESVVGNKASFANVASQYTLPYDLDCLQTDLTDIHVNVAASDRVENTLYCKHSIKFNGLLALAAISKTNSTDNSKPTTTYLSLIKSRGYINFEKFTSLESLINTSGIRLLFQNRRIDKTMIYTNGFTNSTNIVASKPVLVGVFISYDSMGGAEIAHCNAFPDPSNGSTTGPSLPKDTVLSAFCSLSYLMAGDSEPFRGMRQATMNIAGMTTQLETPLPQIGGDLYRCGEEEVGQDGRIIPEDAERNIEGDGWKVGYTYGYRCPRAFFDAARGLTGRVNAVVPSLLFLNALNNGGPSVFLNSTFNENIVNDYRNPNDNVISYEVIMPSDSVRVAALLGFLVTLIVIFLVDELLLRSYGTKIGAIFLALGGLVAENAHKDVMYDGGDDDDDDDGNDETVHATVKVVKAVTSTLDWDKNKSKLVGVGKRRGKIHLGILD
jgi:hypothetical protein